MADLLPMNFPTPSEGIISSYSYTDVAEGTGVIAFDGFNSKISTGTTYHLGTESIASHDIETTSTGGTGSYNFNLSAFNIPKYVRGTAVLRFSAALEHDNINACTLYFTITIQKISGGDTTTIATITSETVSRAGNETYTQNFLLTGALTPTAFKKGDNLRLVFAYTIGGAGFERLTFGHDPTNRAGTYMTNPTTYPNTFDVFIPFRLDL